MTEKNKKQISSKENQSMQDGRDGNQNTQDGHDENSQQKTGLETKRDEKKTSEKPWQQAFEYLYTNSEKNLSAFIEKSNKLLTKCAEDLCLKPLFKNYHTVFLWTKESLDDFHLNRIHERLKEKKSKEKDILLIIDNEGGYIEPAFQISKICNKHKKEKFIVAIPRRAKSAATLISVGANEIHMGDLSQLGPIDPQIYNTPALGIRDALNAIAEIVKKYPESTNLFSQFLDKKINLQILGWLERIPKSASQYAQKLLSINHRLSEKEMEEIASKLVEDYKDHGFVIDADEAKIILGKDIGEKMIQTNTDIIKEIEDFYSKLSEFKDYTERLWTKKDYTFQLHIDIVGKAKCNVFPIIKQRT